MLAILVASPKEEAGRGLAKEIGILLKGEWPVIGPAPASVGKIQDIFRFMIYVKHMDYRRLIEAKNTVETFLAEREEKGMAGKETVQFDFDPMGAY